MRYLNVGETEFTNANGETKVLKDIRPPVVSENAFVVEDVTDELDMLAVRSYGDNAEPLWYNIADQNWTKIIERYFRLEDIKRFEVPLI